MFMAYFLAVANSELDPVSRQLGAQAHNRGALKRYALISLITIINEVFPSYTKIQARMGGRRRRGAERAGGRASGRTWALRAGA